MDVEFFIGTDFFRYNPFSGGIWRKFPSGWREVCGTKDKDGYIVISAPSTGRKRYSAHRCAIFAMTGQWPIEEVDHANHNRADNRWSNLSVSGRVKNQKNRSRGKNNTSGVVGVSWSKQRGRWEVNIGGKYVGWRSNFADAVTLRKAAEKERGYHPNHGQEPATPRHMDNRRGL